MAYCVNCDGGYWVCENHEDRPWEGTSNSEDVCPCGGAGIPCPVCNRGPTIICGIKEIICSVDEPAPPEGE